MKPTKLLRCATIVSAAILLASLVTAADASAQAAPTPPASKPSAPDAVRFVEVTGQVKREGRVLFPPKGGMALLEAIVGAEGHTRFADLRAVQITRTHANGQSVTFLVDVHGILTGQQRDIPLVSGDCVVIPERAGASVGIRPEDRLR